MHLLINRLSLILSKTISLEVDWNRVTIERIEDKDCKVLSFDYFVNENLVSFKGILVVRSNT